MQNSRKLVAAAECAEDFTSVTSVYEAIKKINSEIVEVKLECEEEDLDTDDHGKENGEGGEDKEKNENTNKEKATAIPKFPVRNIMVFSRFPEQLL